MTKKVSIITLGCAKNTADTDNLARVLRARGHDIVEDAKDADAIVVHTCSFIEAAKKESINTILQAGQLKTEGKKLIVTGCLVQQHGDEIFKELPEVDAFLGTGQLGQVADLLEIAEFRAHVFLMAWGIALIQMDSVLIPPQVLPMQVERQSTD